jgi:hypothetical protein
VSAINVIVKSAEVHLLTDGAIYQDETLLSVGPKVNVLPHLNCAVAFRGPYTVRPILAELIGIAASSFDGLRARICELLREASVVYAPVFEACKFGADFEVVVAGWSEDGPQAYMVASHDRHGAPWTIIPLAGLCITPADDVIHANMMAALPAGCIADDLDPAVHGLAIMQIQRVPGGRR